MLRKKRDILEQIGEDDRSLKESPLCRKYVARQPIFDRDKRVVGYELIFRTGAHTIFDEYTKTEGDNSETVPDGFTLLGMKELSGGKQMFVNFTKELLLSRAASAFPSDLLVVELLDKIEPEASILMACNHLKKNNYRFALDKYVFLPQYVAFMGFMDIVKVNFKETAAEERRDLLQQTNGSDIIFLAEKVETPEEFKEAKDLGYGLFQGDFFSKPIIVSSKDIPVLKANLLNLLNELYQPDADLTKIEQVIKKDVSLAYKLLRFINSAAFGLPVEVNSILHALNLLGLFELRKWISLVVLSQLSHEEPEELMISSIVRARFSELISQQIGMENRSAEFFIMGLFSLIDVFFERPMEDILAGLPISNDIKDALTGKSGVFKDVLDFTCLYEKAEWETMFEISTRIKLDEEVVPELYFETIVWSNALAFLREKIK